ncbi:MAG: T9SS type A sorting domain-containing protein, partial [Bacteroidales bacterium]|nr:T9SS type A sorting domain-containing protein [Bacteroidales bacterium]
VDSEWVLGNLTLIAFVNDWNNSNVNDREIYNSIKMPLSDFVSVDPANIAGLKIFPNPATDVLNIANAENADVQIFNITGQMIHRISNASALESISTENMPQGTYIIKITKDNLTRTEKVVITK